MRNLTLVIILILLIPNIASANSDIKICTKEYSPICGQAPMPKCAEWMMCVQMMPAPKTYWNKCMMESEKATFISNWECETDKIIINSWSIDQKETLNNYKLSPETKEKADKLILKIKDKLKDSKFKKYLLKKKLKDLKENRKDMTDLIDYIIENMDK